MQSIMGHANHSVYKEAFEASLDAIVCSDETGLITLWNPAAEKMFGYKQTEILGQPVTTLIPSSDQEKHSQGFNHLISTGESRLSGHIVEVTGIRKDGSIFPVEISLSSIQTGSHWQITAILRDCTARKQSEATLRESKKRLHDMIDANPVPTIIARMSDGLIKYANPEFATLFKIPCDKVVGKQMPDYFVHPEQRNEIIKKLGEVGRIQSREVHLRRQDGTFFWAILTLSTFELDEKTSLITSFHDITERKRASEKLRQFEHIVSSSTDMMALLDKHFIYRAANAAYLAAFGLTYNELIGHPAQEIFGEIFFNKAVKPLAKRCLAGEVVNYLGWMKFPVYETRFMDIHFYPYRNADKEVTGYVVNGRNITEHRQADKLLRKMSSAVDQAGASILITDRDGVIEYVNPAFTKLTGYMAKEAIGQTPRLLKSDGQNDAFYVVLWKTITDGKVWHNKVVDRKKDGSFFPAMLTIAPIFDDDGIITHFVGTYSDLSTLEDMEQQFHQAQKMEEIGTLAGGIAHDFNNMLAGITGNIFLAKRDAMLSPELIKRLSNIEQVSQRAAEMISQLLAFARKSTVAMKEMPLAAFIKETLKFIHASVPENITMHQDICSEVLLIKGDVTQLHQVLMNLVNNARDAVENVNKPYIAVMLEAFYTDAAFLEKHSYFKTGSYAHLSVEDNGYGIAKKQLKHLFEPFFTTKKQGKGTGLGLSMVFGAIKTHHGYVDVDSTEGKGSTFHIYIPLLEQQTITCNPVRQQITTEGHGELILVVDDDQVVRETTAEVLKAMGYTVVQAVDGLDAIDLFKTRRSAIALLLLDVVMPHMGGVQLAERIRAMNLDIPIIFMTGYDKEHVLDGNQEIPNSKTLTKPLTFDHLNHAIRQLLDQT